METPRHDTAVSAALTGITASVAGVIANLAFSFGEHTLLEQTFAWAWAAGHRAGPSGQDRRAGRARTDPQGKSRKIWATPVRADRRA